MSAAETRFDKLKQTNTMNEYSETESKGVHTIIPTNTETPLRLNNMNLQDGEAPVTNTID